MKTGKALCELRLSSTQHQRAGREQIAEGHTRRGEAAPEAPLVPGCVFNEQDDRAAIRGTGAQALMPSHA
jgi:hypothetical protein